MAEPTLSSGYASIIRAMGVAANYGRDSAAWTGNKAYILDDLVAMMKLGLARFYNERDWSFLKLPIEIPLYAPYSTGTVTVVAGVVTLSGGTFPTWAADGDFVCGLAYSVASRDSGTQLTLNDTSVAKSAGTTYSLVQAGYTLPDDFGHIIGGELQYRSGESQGPATLKIMTVDAIRNARYDGTNYSTYPHAAAIIDKPIASADTVGQRKKMLFFPPTNAASRLLGRYRAYPNTLTSGQFPYGGALHSPTITAACCAETQTQLGIQDGFDWESRYQALLAQSIERDKDAGLVGSLGFDRGAEPNWDAFDSADWTSPSTDPPTVTQ